MEITDAIEDAKELLGIKVLTSENIKDIEEPYTRTFRRGSTR